jgi:hypothetical protein
MDTKEKNGTQNKKNQWLKDNCKPLPTNWGGLL